MSSNPHGDNNEKEISAYLDGKTFKDLNLTMKEFIKYICKSKNIAYDDNMTIRSSYEKNKKLKQDIYITIQKCTFGVSLKMGSGNSTHQEKIEDFINFIKEKFNANDEICDIWRFFIWADGTLDGSGSIEKDGSGKIISRFTASEFKKNYPQKREKLQEFLNQNLEILINRFLFVGRYNSEVDFIYHGTYQSGIWVSKDEIIAYQKSKINSNGSACLYLGNLTLQAWNVGTKGTTASEKKRGQLQVKYGKIGDDFQNLMKNSSQIVGTFFGDLEEFDLSKKLNSNKNNSMWKILFPQEHNFEKYFVVKVSSNQYSNLSEKYVKTKSDAYVIKADLDRNFLLSKEFALNENDIKNIKYEIQNDTGISIKIKNSTNFTYQKFTTKSFCKAFKELEKPILWFISLLLYSKENELYKNEKIITDNGYAIQNYQNEIYKTTNILFDNTTKSCDLIRKFAQEKINKMIKENLELAENIFLGKQWFSSPYHANFIYKNGTLNKNKIPDFIITTGSGRTKGKYSIEIKPK